ncbi:ATP-dependent DNA helicase Q-like 3 [Acropora cervicornis]|uniref:ATP-dependent DNA helicase Q-like 3 n=1 Tax=Acropora cervicornis TaxID=6130 RepID=A0AAD9Q437_ACRCE|nr:ATP-dependent DNA helicase Q-like 3 [Acropora cervicornis]
MAATARYDFEDILAVALAFDSSSSDDSSDEDDLDLRLVDAIFPETSKPDYIRLNLEDLIEIQCKTMFRKSFRPAFEKLHFLTSLFAKTPIISLTATATKLTQQKIEESLGLTTPIVIDVNPDRKNIHFSSLRRGNQGMKG